MIGRIISIEEDIDDDQTLYLIFDISAYEDHNRSVASHNWIDEDGNPTLTWFDTQWYPKDGICKIYDNGTLDSEIALFDILPGCSCCHGDEALYYENDIKEKYFMKKMFFVEHKKTIIISFFAVILVFSCFIVWAAKTRGESYFPLLEKIDDTNRGLIGNETIVDGDLGGIIGSEAIADEDVGNRSILDRVYMNMGAESAKTDLITKWENENGISPSVIRDVNVQDGITPELIGGNNAMGIFTKDDGSGWTLKKGDKLCWDFEKYPLNSGSEVGQSLIIGYIKDGTLFDGKLFQSQLSETYEVEATEDGLYYIYIQFVSSDNISLKEGEIYVK